MHNQHLQVTGPASSGKSSHAAHVAGDAIADGHHVWVYSAHTNDLHYTYPFRAERVTTDTLAVNMLRAATERARTPGEHRETPLTVILDEPPSTLWDNHPQAADYLRELLRTGRAKNVRIVLVTTRNGPLGRFPNLPREWAGDVETQMKTVLLDNATKTPTERHPELWVQQYCEQTATRLMNVMKTTHDTEVDDLYRPLDNSILHTVIVQEGGGTTVRFWWNCDTGWRYNATDLQAPDRVMNLKVDATPGEFADEARLVILEHHTPVSVEHAADEALARVLDVLDCLNDDTYQQARRRLLNKLTTDQLTVTGQE